MSYLKVPLEHPQPNKQPIRQRRNQSKNELYRQDNDYIRPHVLCELGWSHLIYAEIISVT
ncbi:8800_t:CDS:1, partial [Acaulospora morrowiae]